MHAQLVESMRDDGLTASPIGKPSALLVVEAFRRMKILVLNSGSSSQKACLYEIGDTLPDDPPVPVWQGRIESNGDTAAMTVKNLRGVSKTKN